MEDNSLFDKLACDGENWARLQNTPLLELIYYCTFFVLKKDVYSGFQNNSGGGGGVFCNCSENCSFALIIPHKLL